METIRVNTSTQYNILIDDNLLDNCGKLIKEVTSADTIAIITDDNVDKYYGKQVALSLKSQGYNVCKFVFPHGEKQKNYRTLLDIYDFLIENKLTRTDCLVALGGGVVGDITGFAAATYLRGIDFIQIPTSLLAQVDSSVGGKTGIDLECGKNLVGAFKQPKLVLCSISALSTLTDEFFSDGMGEVVKYGMIKSPELFDIISKENIKNNSTLLKEVISKCIGIKRDVVEADEFETGERKLLNFGHTLGHAIEKAGNFTSITHGKAVGIGMALMSNICVTNGLCDKNAHNKLIDCLIKYDIPVSCEYTINELISYSLTDKKRNGNNISLIICPDIGKSQIIKLNIEDYKKFIIGGKDGH